MKAKYIVTHPGPAHRDEFLAVSIVLAHLAEAVPVYRRNPTADEMTDPDVWVIDVGQELDYRLHNFDHHQFAPRGRCAFSYVLNAKEIDLVAQFDQAYGWINFTDTLDVQGPYKAAEMIGVTFEQLRPTLSPIEAGMLKAFETLPELTSKHWLYTAMRVLGQGMVDYAAKLQARLAWLKENARIVRIGDVAAIEVVRTPVSEQDPALGMDIFRKRVMPGTVLSITPDPRGKGYALYRYEDNPRVNFSVLDGQPSVVFAHKGGFYATVDTLDLEWVRALAAQGVK